MNQEHEYGGITPLLSAFSSIKEVDIYQKLAFRLVHRVKQKKPNATSVLEICLGESIFSDLLQDAYQNTDFFLMKVDKDNNWNPLRIKHISTYGIGIIPSLFDIIIVSFCSQPDEGLKSLLEYCRTKLSRKGIFASVLLGSDTFLELNTCITWMENQLDCTFPSSLYPTCMEWEQQLKEIGLLVESKEEWFRQSYSNSHELFRIAATFDFFDPIGNATSPEMNHFFREWMKTYDRGYRNKDGRIYTTYHLIELIGYFL